MFRSDIFFQYGGFSALNEISAHGTNDGIGARFFLCRIQLIEMAVMKEKTTIIKKVSRVIAAAVIVLEVIETIDRTVRIVQERREDA